MNELLNMINTNRNWATILTRSPYFLKLKFSGPFCLICYSQLDSDFSNPIVRAARGVVIDLNDLSVACCPMPKFMNYTEIPARDRPAIDISQSTVTEKMDGFLLNIWWDKYKGKWRFSTNGEFAEHAPLPYQTLSSTKFKNHYELAKYILDTKYPDVLAHMYAFSTYSFELTSPEYKVVVDYDEPKLSFITSHINETQIELTDDKFPNYIDTVAKYNFANMPDMCKWIDSKSNFEGVVVNYQGTRYKFKNTKYLMHASSISSLENVNDQVVFKLLMQEMEDDILGSNIMNLEWRLDYVKNVVYRPFMLSVSRDTELCLRYMHLDKSEYMSIINNDIMFIDVANYIYENKTISDPRTMMTRGKNVLIRYNTLYKKILHAFGLIDRDHALPCNGAIVRRYDGVLYNIVDADIGYEEPNYDIPYKKMATNVSNKNFAPIQYRPETNTYTRVNDKDVRYVLLSSDHVFTLQSYSDYMSQVHGHVQYTKIK